MTDIYSIYSLDDLKTLAKGVIPNYSKMKKKTLIVELVNRGIISPNAKNKNALYPFKGIETSLDDLDKKIPIPDALSEYQYIYTAGSNHNEIKRYFIVPDNTVLTGVQVGDHKNRIPSRTINLTVKDYLDHLDNNPNGFYIHQGKPYSLDIVKINGLNEKQAVVNQVAPRIASHNWDYIINTHKVVDVKTGKATFPQLRRNYQIIQQY